MEMESWDSLQEVIRGECREMIQEFLSESETASDAHHRELDSISASTDAFYLMYAGSVVFLMQAGFALLEAGSLQRKNVQNILFKNILDPCFGAIAFWALGYGFAYGTTGGTSFLGTKWFLLDTFSDSSESSDFETEDSYHAWFFQYAFAATTATIVSGAVAERCKLEAYFMYSFYICLFVYPAVVHWVWSSEGFMSAFLDTDDKPILNIGVIDFAGSGVVHLCGAVAALCGAAVLGPRHNLYLPDGSKNHKLGGHDPVLVVLGTVILWFGWYGFNPGSTLGITGGYAHIASKSATTTTLSAAAGGVTNAMLHHYISGKWRLAETCNGVLGGLVGITAGCSVVETWAAVVIGIFSAFIYTGVDKLLLYFGIDDPVNVIPVHGGCGIWGCISVGLFASREMMKTTYGLSEAGLFYSGEVKMLGLQIMEVVVIIGWVVVTTLPFFLILKKLDMLRLPDDIQDKGIDRAEHLRSSECSSPISPITNTKTDVIEMVAFDE